MLVQWQYFPVDIVSSVVSCLLDSNPSIGPKLTYCLLNFAKKF